MLRNTPVRLLEISDIPEENMSRATPSSTNDAQSALPLPTHSYPSVYESLNLETIYKTLSPDITPERLFRTPDDQLLFFWCERAHLYLQEPDYGGEIISIWNEKGDCVGVTLQLSILGDLNGNWEKSDFSATKQMKAEVIAIASDQMNGRSKRKKLNVNLVLFLIKRREGIAYRVAMIDHISMRDWLECKREKILVALG